MPTLTDYTSVNSTGSPASSKTTPTIIWTPPAPINYGTALSAAQLNAGSATAGRFVYTPDLGTVLAAGAHLLSVTLYPTESANHNSATQTVSLIVNKATPAIIWPAPATITYGTALSAAQLNASSDTAGSFVYTPASGAVVAAGSQTLSVTLNPTDSTNYTSATQTVSLNVNKATPVIAWPSPAPIPFGTPLSSAQLSAASDTAGSFVYAPASGTVLAAGLQPLSVTFDPIDTIDYTSATQTVSLTVNRVALRITASSPTVTYGVSAPTITPSYAGFKNGDSSSVLTTQPTCSATYTAASTAGSSPSTNCSGATSTNYTIGYVPGTVTVRKAPLTITASSPTVTYGASVPTIMPRYSGFVNGDSSAVLAARPICSTTYTETSPVGSSPSTSCSGAAAANYTISYVTGTVTVNKAPAQSPAPQH